MLKSMLFCSDGCEHISARACYLLPLEWTDRRNEVYVFIWFYSEKIDNFITASFDTVFKKTGHWIKNYALRLLLAGKHSENRKITVKYQNKQKDFYPDQPINLLKEHKYNGDIESKIINQNIGYIRINNRLWDNNIISLFDSVLASL